MALQVETIAIKPTTVVRMYPEQADKELKQCNFSLSDREFQRLLNQHKLGQDVFLKRLTWHYYKFVEQFLLSNIEATPLEAHSAFVAVAAVFLKRLKANEISYGNLKGSFADVALQRQAAPEVWEITFANDVDYINDCQAVETVLTAQNFDLSFEMFQKQLAQHQSLMADKTVLSTANPLLSSIAKPVFYEKFIKILRGVKGVSETVAYDVFADTMLTFSNGFESNKLKYGNLSSYFIQSGIYACMAKQGYQRPSERTTPKPQEYYYAPQDEPLIFESEVVFDYEADWFADGGIFEDEIPKILGFRLHDRNDKKVRAINKAWQLLKSECQSVLRLYYEEEKNYKEMAAEMKSSTGTIGKKLSDCKGYFKTAYTKIFDNLK